MPLIVPILRLVMLFLNVYDSFKTLKLPVPSSRNGGRPSARAMTQRKRDMKGCLAIWIVWCCFTSYERLLEGVVYLFVPFYDEMKCLVLLFLIFTRARGAEPIYLHVIRPLLKPYTATLDILLDLICMIGDILFLLGMFPFRAALSWRKGWFKSDSDVQLDTFGDAPELGLSSDATEGTRESRGSSEALIGRPLSALRFLGNSQQENHTDKSRRPTEKLSRYPVTAMSRGSVRTRRQAMESSQHSLASSVGLKAHPRSASQPQHQHSRQTSGSLSEPQYEIWRPSLIHQNLDGERTSRLSVPLDSIKPPTTVSDERSVEQQQEEDWRQYPPFPSAYPPTPLVTNTRLSSDLEPTSFISHRSPEPVKFPAIPEESRQQDFSQSLLPQRKPLHPSLPTSSSDSNNSNDGVQNIKQDADVTVMVQHADMVSESSGDEIDSDVDLDMTLRTPLHGGSRPRVYNKSATLASIASSSNSSLPSRSTALTTIDNGSSLRTRTTSESESSLSFSDTSFIAGRKRSLPRNNSGEDHDNIQVFGGTGAVHNRVIVRNRVKRPAPTHLIKMSQRQVVRSMSKEATSDEEKSSDSGVDGVRIQVPPIVKRRKVLTPPACNPAVYSTRTRVRAREVSARIQQTKSLDGSRAASRTSSRLRPGQPSTHRSTSAQSAPSGSHANVSSNVSATSLQRAIRRTTARS